METIQSRQVVVGAGVVGLAIAEKLAGEGLIVLEAHSGFGKETSSRNSEVIHSGIHYPKDSLKTQLCLEGRELLLAFANAHDIPHSLCGKVTLAVNEGEQAYLERLYTHARTLGVPCEHWDRSKLRKEEPNLEALSAVFFPGSGIVDSHSLMSVLEKRILARGAVLAYQHRVVRVQREVAKWVLEVESPHGIVRVIADQVVNAAGLHAASLAAMANPENGFEHRFCRGRYLRLRNPLGFRRLVYPVPDKDGLGIHITLDLAGQVRFGPDTDWDISQNLDDLDRHYDCDWSEVVPRFARAIEKYFPALVVADLSSGLVGIRPKLFIGGRPHPDFVLESTDNWVNCLGIESPGLTASLAIAGRVARLCAEGEMG